MRMCFSLSPSLLIPPLTHHYGSGRRSVRSSRSRPRATDRPKDTVHLFDFISDCSAPPVCRPPRERDLLSWAAVESIVSGNLR